MIEFTSLFSELTLTVFTLFLIFALIIPLYLKLKYYNVWSSQGIPGPPPIPLIGNMLDILYAPFSETQLRRAKKYGRLYGIYEGLKPKLIVADRNLVKQICVKDFNLFVNRRKIDTFDEIFDNMLHLVKDSQWNRLRKIITPTFTTGKIKRMKPLIEKCARNATDYLETVAERQEEVNLKRFWSRFTLEVITSCCFAIEINLHKDADNPLLKHVTFFFSELSLKRKLIAVLFFILPSQLFKLLGLSFFESEATVYLKKVITHLLKKRREQDGTFHDFLQLLIEAENEDEKDSSTLTELEIIANSFLFFVAGYETTSTLLHYCSYCLAANPESQQKLYQEIKQHFNSDDDIDYETANKLPCLDAIIRETFRMFPPIVVNERTTSVDVHLSEAGITIPADSIINFPVYAIHRDLEYYPEPDQFKPERFLSENREKLDQYAYLPFGVGPRRCIAMRFALLEAKLAIIQTVSKFKILKTSKILEPKFNKFTNVLISGDIFVGIVKR